MLPQALDPDYSRYFICFTHMSSTSVISTYSCEILSDKFGSIGFHSVLLLLNTEINIIRTRHKKSQGISIGGKIHSVCVYKMLYILYMPKCWLWSTSPQKSSTCAKGKCTYLIVVVCKLSIFPVGAFIFSTLTLDISQPLHCHSIISSVLLVALVIQHFFRTLCSCFWWTFLPCHNGPLAKKNHTGLQGFLSLTHGVKTWSSPMSCSLYNCFRWPLNGLS